MEKQEFNELLKKANLTKKEFAGLVDMTYGAVNNWGTSQPFPRWVESWIENYIAKKKFENIKNMIKDEL